ncbi:30S ribosome-binding factor RbfA [Woodsholea maritima]|uniref:30S ribosome-binding factor RbfA n=1 Tax=Woodsholea maritima TaxID=240237 RepID=UPI00036E75A9|nr:30S ribosome-binding factor RbfA [Woodsholea maritima]
MKAQSQRQLRAGELVRHAVSDILKEGYLRDPILAGVSITVTEVRCSPDLKHATCLISALGRKDVKAIAEALNHASGYLQRALGKEVDLKFTPKLRFEEDTRFEEASHIDDVLNRATVRRDLGEN